MAGGADRGQLRRGQHRPVEVELAAMNGGFDEQIVFPPEGGGEGGDQFFADGVQGRVGHLGEELAEVVVKQARPLGQDGQGDIVAHGPGGFLALCGHGTQHQLEVFGRIAEAPLFGQQRRAGRQRRRCRGRQVPKAAQVFFQPAPVRPPGGHGGLDIVIVDDVVVFQIHQEHAARLQAPLVGHVCRIHRQHAGFRRHDHPAVAGHRVAAGAQPVAVQNRSDLNAVGKRDRRRSVPGLHETTVVGVKVPFGPAHGRMVLPRLGHQHHHALGKGAAGMEQQFQGVVQGGRVAAAGRADRTELGHRAAAGAIPQERFTGAHPVDVAAKRVDFAVVAQIAERLGQIPGGKGVGTVALMHQGQGAGHGRVAQIGIKGDHLIGQQHALVDHGAGGEAGNVKQAVVHIAHGPDPILGRFAGQIKLPFEGRGISSEVAFTHEGHADGRHYPSRQVAGSLGIDRHVAPTQKNQPAAVDGVDQGGFRCPTVSWVVGQKNDPGGIVALPG